MGHAVSRVPLERHPSKVSAGAGRGRGEGRGADRSCQRGASPRESPTVQETGDGGKDAFSSSLGDGLDPPREPGGGAGAP